MEKRSHFIVINVMYQSPEEIKGKNFNNNLIQISLAKVVVEIIETFVN